MSELRDLYDINSNKTNKTYHKGEVIPKGFYPMVVMAVIRNSKGEFLMQKRTISKGGDWGVTGGHPKSGETPIEGIITEVKEELGLVFSKDDFIEYDSGCDGKDCYKMYYVNKDIDINDIIIQENELSEVKWFTMEELENMVKNKELNEDQIACFVKVKKYLENNRVVLENNYDKWKQMFEEEKEKLTKIFNQDSFVIEHVGSTSVKGILAKPIVDIAVGINDFSELDKYRNVLEKEYTVKDKLDKKEILLIKENDKERLFLIHVLLINDNRYKNMIRFRDILSSNKIVLKEYENLKIKLSKQYANNRPMYTKSKKDFIERILKEF